MTKRVLAAAAAAVVAMTPAACGGGEQVDTKGALVIDKVEIADEKLWQAAQKEGTLTLYTALGEERENALLEVFKEQTGLEINVVRLPGSSLYERIQSEHGADKLGADVIRQTDIALALDERKEGVFQKYCPPNFDQLDKNLKQKDCSFYASQTPIYSLGYNHEQIPKEKAPKTWKELLEPQWKGKLGLAHVGAGGSTWARDLFLRQKYGVEYWKKLAAMKPQIASGAEGVTAEMARGEIQLGMVLPGNQSLVASDGAPLSVTIPKDGVPSYGQWFGMADKAEHPAAAKVFINWQMSMPGQKSVAHEGGDYPVIDGAPGPDFNGKELPKREDIELVQMETDPQYLAKREAYMKEWFQIFNYTPSDTE